MVLPSSAAFLLSDGRGLDPVITGGTAFVVDFLDNVDEFR